LQPSPADGRCDGKKRSDGPFRGDGIRQINKGTIKGLPPARRASGFADRPLVVKNTTSHASRIHEVAIHVAPCVASPTEAGNPGLGRSDDLANHTLRYDPAPSAHG
jgi:hypothetical protein